jgi:NADPH:quinone reductase and related Zn-dependent oxidoreductases
MKAIVYQKYGSPDVLELQEVDKPVIADDQLLVRVYASSLNMGEWHAMTGLYVARPSTGWRKPKDPWLGVDFAGVVEAVGSSVTQFKPGDEVFGGRNGAFAEYVAIREQRAVVLKSPKLTFEQAASIPVAALTALQGLRDKGQIQPGQKVLINGASGGVGTFAMQLAKVFGAEVTAVCSTKKVDLMRSLGADHVVDYTREDFTRNGQRYDLILDIAGSRSWSEYKRVLKPNATFVLIGSSKTNRVLGPLNHILKVKLASLRATQKVIFFIANLNKADLSFIQELIETGKVNPVIERTYPLRNLPEAMRYLGTGHVQGKLIVTMDKQ